jgi:hypothetical protein
VALEVDDFSGAMNRLREWGCTFTLEPMETPRVSHGGSLRSRWELCDDSSEKNGMNTSLLGRQLNG